MSWGSSTCPTQLKVDRGGRLVDKKHPTGLSWEASWWRTSWLTCWWRWNSLLLQSSWKNINQSQRHIDLWISLHDSDSGWVGPDKGPFNRRRTPLCRSGAAVVNARANGVLQILSQPMSMEVVTEQRSKRCCTLHADVLNFCTIISDVRCKFLHLGRLCSQYGGIYYLDHHNGLHWIKNRRQVKSIVICFSALSPSFSTQWNCWWQEDKPHHLITSLSKAATLLQWNWWWQEDKARSSPPLELLNTCTIIPCVVCFYFCTQIVVGSHVDEH